jgi:hypothetical protein
MVSIAKKSLEKRNLELAVYVTRYSPTQTIRATDFTVQLDSDPDPKCHELCTPVSYTHTSSAVGMMRRWQIMQRHVDAMFIVTEKLANECVTKRVGKYKIDHFQHISDVLYDVLQPSLAVYTMKFLVEDATPYQTASNPDDELVKRFATVAKRPIAELNQDTQLHVEVCKGDFVPFPKPRFVCVTCVMESKS